VLLTYDSDEAGTKAALRAIPLLKEAGISVRVINMKPYKDPDEFIKHLGADAFQKRMDEAESSFMYELSVIERDYDLKDPEGKTAFQKAAARKLLEFSEEMERNNYMEAVADKYHIGYENLKRHVSELGNKGYVPSKEEKQERVSVKRQEKDDGMLLSQKLLLTWLIEKPELYPQIQEYISPEDFTGDLYRSIAEMLFVQLDEGNINPARIISSFEEPEEQSAAAALFNAKLKRIETREEQEKALIETIRRVKQYSLDTWAKNLDVTDMVGFQRLIQARSELQKLEKLHISIE